MKLKKTIYKSILISLFAFSIVISFSIKVSAKPDLPVYNMNTKLDYATIQEAIDAPETLDGDTIFVRIGTYYEHVILTKDLTLIGEDKNTTIIDGNKNGTVISIKSVNYCGISGFTIQNSSRWYSSLPLLKSIGISVLDSEGVVLNQNIIKATEYGIYFANSSGSTIYDTILTANDDYDIYLSQSKNLIVSENSIFDSLGQSGIFMKSSFHNIIDRNTIRLGFGNAITLEDSYENIVENNWLTEKSWDGIDLLNSYNNTIAGNTIEKNWRGIVLHDARDNKIYHNNFIDNKETTGIMRQIVIYGSNNTNMWDDSLGRGNYWSDYKGQDLNNNSIGDTSYLIDKKNQDDYPLMKPLVIAQEKMRILYNELLSDYDSLQTEYVNLESEQEYAINELNTFRNLMYIFIATTAIFLVMTAYLIIRKSKVSNQLRK